MRISDWISDVCSSDLLSSDSRIVVALSRSERRIDLQRGEAFFHAARDAGRPFVVAAAGHRVIAVGTRFAVRRDADGVRVVVTEGLVRLESDPGRSEEHTSELQSLMRISYAVFCLKKKKT